MRLKACPVTAPAAKTAVLAHQAFPLRSAPPHCPPPGAVPAWQLGTVDSGVFSGPAAHGPAVQPGGIAGHLARAAGEVIASLVR